MTQQNKSSKEDKKSIDEIGFEELIQNIIKLFVSLFNTTVINILNLLITVRRFVIRKFYYLITGVILGALAGYFYSNVIPPTYETSLTLKSEFLTGFDFLYEIEKLNDYIENENSELIARLFKSEDNNVNVIKGIHAESYYNYHHIFERYGEIEKLDSLSVASEINAKLFVVTLKMNSDAVALENIEDWLINFLEQNKLLNKNYNIRKTILLNTEEKLLSDLVSLDTLKNTINRKLIEGDNVNAKLDISFSEVEDILKDPISVYEKGFSTFNQLQDVRKELTLIEKVSIINGIKFVKENRFNFKFRTIVIGVSLGFSFVCLLFIVISFNKLLNDIENKS
jgi:hypothetical protein